LKQLLFERRLLLARLLGAGCKLGVVVELLSRRFGVSRAAVYKDYERMHRWIVNFEFNNHEVCLYRERLEVLWRETVRVFLDEKENRSVKLKALKLGLKIVKVQIKLGYALGIIKRKAPPKRMDNLSKHLPLQYNPIIKQAILRASKTRRWNNT